MNIHKNARLTLLRRIEMVKDMTERGLNAVADQHARRPQGPEEARAGESPLWTSLFKHLGAAPASINFAETYSSLQTKVVDGQENPLAIISIAKLYEVQKYCSMTNHMWEGYWCMTNQMV